MKAKLLLIVLVCLSFFAERGISQPKLIPEVRKDSLWVQASAEGREGWRGCYWESCKPAAAYYFLVYKMTEGKEKRELVRSWKGNRPQAVFTDVSSGEYQLECWYGRPLGCRIFDWQGEEKGRSNVYFCVQKRIFVQ